MLEKKVFNNLESYISNEDLELHNFKVEDLINFLKQMILIRKSEFKIAYGRKQGFIKGPVHLGVGQEAIPVSISNYLTKKDIVFGAHRSHSHIISLGIDIKALFAEILAKSTGISKGMGGSMHLYGESVGFYGSVPIVAGTVPLAVGSALASKLKGDNNISVVYFGDGAIEEGIVHESLNLARIHNCPVLFVVENNQFSSHLNINLRQPKNLISRFADANDIEYEIVDGNNIISLCKTASALINKIRIGKGPCFIEAITYRWFGHVDWREDIDVGVNRSALDIKDWKKRDPIKRLSNSLIKNLYISMAEINQIENSIQNEIDKSWEKALADPSPTWEETKNYNFKN